MLGTTALIPVLLRAVEQEAFLSFAIVRLTCLTYLLLLILEVVGVNGMVMRPEVDGLLRSISNLC